MWVETLSPAPDYGRTKGLGFLRPQLLPPTQPQFMQPGSRGEIKSTLFLVPSSMTSEESQIKSRNRTLSRARHLFLLGSALDLLTFPV